MSDTATVRARSLTTRAGKGGGVKGSTETIRQPTTDAEQRHNTKMQLKVIFRPLGQLALSRAEAIIVNRDL